MGLNKVQEIERAVRALKPQELEELYSCLERNCPQPIDTRFQADLAAGHLDNAIQRALDDEKNGRVQPLQDWMQHHATAEFWREYRALPQEIRNRADEKFSLLKSNQQHPSIQFKKLGERQGQEIWSARITLNYRALAIKRTGGYLWFWIGDHGTYDSLVA